MKKLLLLIGLFIFLAPKVMSDASNIYKNETPRDVIISNTDILNYSCLDTTFFRGFPSCFCRGTGEKDWEYKPDEVLKIENRDNRPNTRKSSCIWGYSSISYGEYLQFGGRIIHFDHATNNDVSNNIKGFKDTYKNFNNMYLTLSSPNNKNQTTQVAKLKSEKTTTKKKEQIMKSEFYCVDTINSFKFKQIGNCATPSKNVGAHGWDDSVYSRLPQLTQSEAEQFYTEGQSLEKLITEKLTSKHIELSQSQLHKCRIADSNKVVLTKNWDVNKFIDEIINLPKDVEWWNSDRKGDILTIKQFNEINRQLKAKGKHLLEAEIIKKVTSEMACFAEIKLYKDWDANPRIYYSGIYKGRFLDGALDGWGILENTVSILRYEGEFDKGRIKGDGIRTNYDGTKFITRNGIETIIPGKNKNLNPSGKILVYCYRTPESGMTGYYKFYNRCPPGTHIEITEEEYLNKQKQSDTTQVVKVEPKTTTTKQTTQTVVVTNDTTGPEIIVNKTFKTNQNMIANIKGRVEDDSKIVSLTIDGDQVAFTQGRFNQPLYVLPNGQEIEIVAIDKFGNQSKTIVTLKRAAVQIQTVSIDKLNPLAIKTPIDNNAVALIIGVEEYENTFNAAYAKQDALFFNDFAHQAFGVPRQNIKLLTNSGARRNDTLLEIATWLPKIIKENKTNFYLFFSGHGLASSDGNDLFLLPYDGIPQILEASSLLRNDLFQSIAKLNPRSVTVFLDTCYSGATRSEEMLVAARPIMIEVQEQAIPNNFTVFSASANNEIARVFKEAEHGLFSYFLMKGLEGEADSNSDQQITNGELIAFINQKVSRQANQTPQLAGDANRILVEW